MCFNLTDEGIHYEVPRKARKNVPAVTGTPQQREAKKKKKKSKFNFFVFLVLVGPRQLFLNLSRNL